MKCFEVIDNFYNYNPQVLLLENWATSISSLPNLQDEEKGSEEGVYRGSQMGMMNA